MSPSPPACRSWSTARYRAASGHWNRPRPSRSSFPALLQFGPPRHALGDALLLAAIGRGVEGLRAHLLGPVIRPRIAFRRIMVIGIALAVPDILHQPGRGVEDVLRRHQRSGFLRAAP